MRTRAVRPGFWEDSTMAELPISARLTYVGLWCLADDAGYFELNVREIGGALYRHEPRGAVDKRVREAIERLVELERVTLLACGRHAVIPTLPNYRYNAGEQLFTTQKKHRERCEGEQLKVLPGPKHASPAISAATRAKVLSRDGEHCRYCGKHVAENYVFDHVINLGPSTPDNLVVACRSCNVKKSWRTVEEAGMTLHEPGFSPTKEDSLALTSDSLSDSSSSSVSDSSSSSDSGRGGAKKSGSKDPDERDEAIARARARLNSADTSEGVKDAARFALKQLGVPA